MISKFRLLSCLGFAALLATGLAGTQSISLAQDGDQQKVTFTRAQVDRGRSEYSRSCLDCHGANLDDGEFGGPPLKGNAFREKWFGTTADALYGFISTAMPPDRPGRLSPQVYADVTAFILSQNGIMPGNAELPSDLEELATMMVEP